MNNLALSIISVFLLGVLALTFRALYSVPSQITEGQQNAFMEQGQLSIINQIRNLALDNKEITLPDTDGKGQVILVKKAP